MWVQGSDAFVVVDSLDPGENCVFARPGVDRMALLTWAQKRIQAVPEAGWIADTDREMVDALKADGYEPVYAFRHCEMDLTGDLPTAAPPQGWELRAVRGEEEADARRAAAHAAFGSTMDPGMHLERYLGLMRSPVYVRERDLVAVDREGTVGSFMIWWPDETGVAQIEPFGTDPRFHRRGIGRALMYHGLAEMKVAGMKRARVCTRTTDGPQPSSTRRVGSPTWEDSAGGGLLALQAHCKTSDRRTRDVGHMSGPWGPVPQWSLRCPYSKSSPPDQSIDWRRLFKGNSSSPMTKDSSRPPVSGTG
jgi:ribosomal protein S18 acetylase RimI-like enzyme